MKVVQISNYFAEFKGSFISQIELLGKQILEYGGEIIYMNDKYAKTDGVIASKKMLDACGVTYRKYESKGKTLQLNL